MQCVFKATVLVAQSVCAGDTDIIDELPLIFFVVMLQEDRQDGFVENDVRI